MMEKALTKTLRKYLVPENRSLAMALSVNFCASAKVKDLQEGSFDFDWQSES
jgi:hypothetical protein